MYHNALFIVNTNAVFRNHLYPSQDVKTNNIFSTVIGE